MNYKSLFNIIIATICMCNINSYASSNLKINEICDNVSVNSEQMELLSQSDNNDSYVTLYNNTPKQLDHGCVQLQVQHSNININNRLDILNNINKINNSNVEYNISEQNVKSKDKNKQCLCYHFTKIVKGIITIPILFGSYAISTSDFAIKDNDKSSEIAISNLRNGSKEVMWISFDNTIKHCKNTTNLIWNYVTNAGSCVITVSNNIKSHLNKKIFC